MRGPYLLFPLLILLSFLVGCASPQRAYRDPLTYTFEGEAPPSSETEWHDFKGKVEETSKKIRAIEDKYLW